MFVSPTQLFYMSSTLILCLQHAWCNLLYLYGHIKAFMWGTEVLRFLQMLKTLSNGSHIHNTRPWPAIKHFVEKGPRLIPPTISEINRTDECIHNFSDYVSWYTHDCMSYFTILVWYNIFCSPIRALCSLCFSDKSLSGCWGQSVSSLVSCTLICLRYTDIRCYNNSLCFIEREFLFLLSCFFIYYKHSGSHPQGITQTLWVQSWSNDYKSVYRYKHDKFIWSTVLTK